MARCGRPARITGLLVLLAAGCGSEGRREEPPGGYWAAPDPWVLTCTDPNDATPALLWNGLIGVRIGRDGSGVDANNGPLGFLAIDEFQWEGEEKIVPLPTPVVFKFSNSRHDPIGPRFGKSYRQALDMRTGTLTTEWEQVVDGANVMVSSKAILHPSRRILGQKWTFTADRRVAIYGGGWPKGASQEEASEQVGDNHRRIQFEWPPHRRKVLFDWSGTGEPDPGRGSTLVFESSDGGPSFIAVAKPGRPATLTTMSSFGLSSTYFVRRSQSGVAVKPAKGWDRPPAIPTFSALADESRKSLSGRWKTDIEIDGPAEDQQAVRSFLFYLRSAIHPDGGMSISPFGLSNPLYNGHVFWDADMWVFPALALIEPEVAMRISDYRVRREREARDYYADSLWGDQAARIELPRGRRFPWESSVTGKEAAPGTHLKQIHVTGSVAWMLTQARSYDLADHTIANDVRASASEFFLAWAAKSGGGSGGHLQLKGVMSPDETHLGDNDLYTNLLAQWCANGGTWDIASGRGANTHGLKTGATFKLPRDSQTFLTYDNDPLRAYMQAAAVLAIYPLQYPPAEGEARKMMKRFENKIAENGPAMSDSIHAVIWARLNEPERAYAAWRKSWQRYMNHPLMLFSERPKSGQTYFTTGAAGSLNAVIYGFLGFRIDTKPEAGAVWSKKLHGGRWLSVKPRLPKAWKCVTFRNFRVLGRTYTLTATHDGARVTQGDR